MINNIFFKAEVFILLCLFTAYSYGFELNHIKSYKADFKQTIINPQGKVLDYSGKIYIKYPSLVLWEYIKPIEKSIYIKDDVVTIIEPDLEQAIITKLDNNIDIFKIFQNAKKISTNKYKTLYNNKYYYIIVKNNQIKNISYKDELDNNITIVFSNIDQNQLIATSIFEFMIPFEYDIIRK